MLRSNFIKPKLSIDFFGQTRFWVGLFLGLGYGFLMYCFFNFLNLGLYYFCYMDWAGFTITTPAESQFYHFLFAFAAFLFGQNIFFEFTLSKSKAFRKDTSREFTILHHSRMATWYTFFVGFAWCTTLRLLAFSNVFLIYDFFNIGWWVSILVMFWLHFYTWMQVSNFFKNIYPIKIFIFLGMTILSFGLSHYDPVPEADTYRNIAKGLAHYKLKVESPSSSGQAFTKLIHKSVIQTIFMGDPEKDKIPNYGTNWGGLFEASGLPVRIENFNIKVPESKKGLIISSLVIDKNLRMKDVYNFLNALAENNRLKISLAALTSTQNNPNVYYEYFDKGLVFTIPPTCDQTKKVAEYLKRNPDLTIDFLTQVEEENFDCPFGLSGLAELSGKENFIKISSTNQFFFDGEEIDPTLIFEKIKNIVWEKKEKAIFVIDVDDEATYEHYFFLRHEHIRAMKEVRNQEALISFGKRYEFLEGTTKREIRIKYPIIIEEFFSEEERFIFNFFRKKIF